MVNYKGIIVMVHIFNKRPQSIYFFINCPYCQLPSKSKSSKTRFCYILTYQKYVKPSNQIKESHWPGKKKSAQQHTTLSIEHLKELSLALPFPLVLQNSHRPTKP
jgi:hypothetical protein